MLEAVKNVNDWLKDYRGKTFSDKLQESLIIGLFQEHSKKAGGMRESSKYISERMGKKCVVYCMDPITKEIEDIGGSSLFKDTITGKYEDNMILDNFGTWFSFIVRGDTSIFTLTDDANSSQSFKVQTTSNIYANNSNWNGRFGSGTTAPIKANYKIETALTSGAPENTYIASSGWGYTGASQIVYNIDASPTAGAGTVQEVITAGVWLNTSSVSKNIALTRDLTGSVSYTTGKLLRAAFAWQI